MERRDFTSPVSYLPLVLLNPSLFFLFVCFFSPSPTTRLPSGGHRFVLCTYESGSVLFVYFY